VRESFLPFHVPDIGETEVESVANTLRSRWLTTGPMVERFEREFARFVGAKYAVALNSATAALHLSLDAIGLRKDDEVVVPTMTFAATAEVVCYFQARLRLIDCDRCTANITAESLERALTTKTRAVIPVHFAGHPCDMSSILQVARQHGLAVIEDAAHALPARYNGTTVGVMGDFTCFSFYATKTITTGEGGMVTTKSKEYEERIRSMSLHGISRDAWKRYAGEGSWYYEIVAPGYKYNMTDVAAAIGVVQLSRIDEMWKRRCQIARRYTEAFSAVEELDLPSVSREVEHAWHLYIIRLRLEALRISREEFIGELKARNIGASVHFIPLHFHPYYRQVLANERRLFPNADWIYERCISLPIYPGMIESDVDDVIQAVTDIAKCRRR